MKLGFTGTRVGMTEAQCKAFVELIKSLVLTEFHHGDCVGSDAESVELIHEVYPQCKRVCHPPIDKSLRAFTEYDEIKEPLTHFARNRNIVMETDMLVATPCQMEHQPKGGTWYTVDYAKKKGKKVNIIYPDGSIDEQNSFGSNEKTT